MALNIVFVHTHLGSKNTMKANMKIVVKFHEI